MACRASMSRRPELTTDRAQTSKTPELTAERHVDSARAVYATQRAYRTLASRIISSPPLGWRLSPIRSQGKADQKNQANSSLHVQSARADSRASLHIESARADGRPNLHVKNTRADGRPSLHVDSPQAPPICISGLRPGSWWYIHSSSRFSRSNC